MSEQLLTILKFCLLALLYLFFLRVLRAVWTEINPPKVAPETAAAGARNRRASKAAKSTRAAPHRAAKRSGSVPDRLVIVEPSARAGGEYLIGQEATVGRAQGCSIVLDEQYVSQVHARFFVRGDTLFVEDLGSTNGTWVNGSRAVGQMPVRISDRVQIGNLIMEAR